jgi:hypothetical protein
MIIIQMFPLEAARENAARLAFWCLTRCQARRIARTLNLRFASEKFGAEFKDMISIYKGSLIAEQPESIRDWPWNSNLLERVSDRCSVNGVGKTNWARRTKQTNPQIRRWSSPEHNAVAASQNARDQRNAL